MTEPTPLPRLLVIMGSGETSPTMSKLHRDLFARLGPSGPLSGVTGPAPVRAVLIDTPFGFQENADDIVAKAISYFRESVNRDVGLASFRSKGDAGTLDHETAMTRLREATWVFSGPGSPSYALSQWRGTAVPVLLAEKLANGGCITFASAAATTLGRFALPVYEIYKVGEAPHWLDGLDLLGPLGLSAVVIPHFNNAEGGHHDTRYCYMGERRLSALELLLPDDVFILGVDEHTACILDLDAGTATVSGLGVLTVRRRGQSATVGSGDTVSIDALARMATGGDVVAEAGRLAQGDDVGRAHWAKSPFLADLRRIEHAFTAGLSGRDVRSAVAGILELDELLVEWSRDTLQSDEAARGRAAVRSMVVRLGETAEVGVRDPRPAVALLVEALLEARQRARADGRWAEADAIRDRLLGAGVEVRDTPTGTEWDLG
ncbi:MAG: hypothetical protein ABR540_02155 [Acidimicrobiales bacterium]